MLAKGTEYAIRALVYIQLQNWKEQHPGVIEIAREIGAPGAYSAKILQTLVRHQLLKSMKGRGGGFFYDNNQSDITIYEVIHVMEGDACFHKCGFGLKNCNCDNPCPLHDQFIQTREGFFNLAKSETIHTLSQKILDGKAVLSRLDQ